MKKLMILAMLLSGTGLLAQEGNFGIKGGINYGATGDYQNVEAGFEDATTIEGKSKSGYHLGLFGNFGLAGIFIQPELMYTRLNTEYGELEYKLDKLDAPVLLGLKVLGPLNIKAGPSFQYILSNELEGSSAEIKDPENAITIGYQLGAGLDFGRLGLDLRYEGAFKENTAFSETASENFQIDSRPSQWALSLSYKL